ncbi:MAG: OmpA family protein [Pseudomonadota bacterium]
MVKKIASVSAIVLTSAVISAGAFAHSGDYIADGSGQKISDGFGNCIKSANGVDIEACNPKPAPAPEPEPPKPAVKPPAKPEFKAAAPKPTLVKVTDTVSLSGDASFATNSDELTADGMAVLDSFVAGLGEVEPVSIVLTGHADSRGSDTYNQALSERRARSVADYIITKGVPASIVSASGAGETQPVASNDTVEGRAANRRVDIEVSANKTVYQ